VFLEHKLLALADLGEALDDVRDAGDSAGRQAIAGAREGRPAFLAEACQRSLDTDQTPDMAIARTRLTEPFSGLGHPPPRFRGGLVVAVERADQVGNAAVSPSDGELHLPSVPH